MFGNKRLNCQVCSYIRMMPAIVLLVVTGLAGQALAGQALLGRWEITVRKACNLVDKDWGKQKLSDPYVEVVANDLQQTVRWRSRVVQDSLNPAWNQVFVWHDTEKWQRGPLLRMTIWDADPNLGASARAFLGKARLSVALSGPGDFVLPLERRFPGLSMPGKLFISVRHLVEARLPVPDLRGSTVAQARVALQGLKLHCRVSESFTMTPTSDAGRIYDQNPKPGTRVKPGREVLLLVHVPMLKPMPRVVGLSVRKARDRLAFLTVQPRVESTASPANARPESWYRVIRQSVPAGKRIALNTGITLWQSIPGPGARVKVPDLSGAGVAEAEKMVRAAFLRVQWSRQESSLERNGRVVSQDPPAGQQVKPGSVVKAKYGHYSDGLCYYSARQVSFGKVESFAFTRPRVSQFRAVQVKRTGYLVLRKQSAPFNLKCSFYGLGSTRILSPGSRFFDQAQRVTPGRWIFAVYPEFDTDVSQTPARIKVDLVPEMDFAEPNNTMDTATPILLDARLNIIFAGVADRDYYRFELKSPGYVKIKYDHAATREYKHALVPQVWLYDSRGRELAWGSVDRAYWLSAGSYYVKFECEISREQFDFRPYPVNISFLGNLDRMEPNNTPAQATRIKLPAALNVCYHTDDHDFYLLQGGTGGYAIFSHARDPGFAVVLQRYDRNGKEIGRRSFLPCAVRVNGDTLVRLEPEMRESYCVRRPLPLGIRFVAASEDPYEPNDKLEQAREIFVNETVQALSLPANDIDTYRFKLDRQAHVTLELPLKPECLVLQARLFDGRGRPLGKRFYLPGDLDLKAGEYIVQLFQESGVEGLHTQAYRFRVKMAGQGGEHAGKPPRYQVCGKADQDVQKGIDLAMEAYKRYLAHKYQEAVALYLRAAKLAPGIAAIWNDMGASYFHLGNLDKAKQGFERAVKLRPGYALAWRNLAVFAGKQGDFKRALPLCEKAVALDPNADNLRYAGYTYYFAGAKTPDQRIELWSRAADFLEQSLNLKPDQLARKRLAQVKAYLGK